MAKKRFTELEFKEIRETLIRQAKARWPDHTIEPCGIKKTLDDCFTIDILKKGYMVMFWYNVDDDTRTERYRFVDEKIQYYLKFNEGEDKNGEI